MRNAIYSIQFPRSWPGDIVGNVHGGRAGVNTMKHALGITLPYMECANPCGWPACYWDPRKTAVERAEWMPGSTYTEATLRQLGRKSSDYHSMKMKTRVKEWFFSPKLLCAVSPAPFLLACQGNVWTWLRKIFNHIICFDNIILGLRKKKQLQPSIYSLFLHWQVWQPLWSSLKP